MSFEKLLEPIDIRGLHLKNRVVMSAMGTHEAGASADQKSVTDKLIAFHVARAKGGCALNTVEVTAIDAASAPHGFLSIAEDKYIDGLKKLNDAVHAAGGKTAVQLWQGGLAVASDRTAQILLASEMKTPNYTIPAISNERILEIIEEYGQAAKRAVEAGFDAIEFHCAHNYLPHSFLSGGLNKRDDEWGGSFENRKKFPLACIASIRKNMPSDMPLFMRIGCHDDFLENGLSVEQTIDFCKDAKAAGVDVLNISRGNIVSAATMYEVAPVEIEHGFNVEDAARIRKETGMLTMPCGRINTPDMAEKILEEDKADLIVMARAQLADPQFVNKAAQGKITEINYCIGCNQGCYDTFCQALYNPAVEHITCMRNPALLEEEAYGFKKTTDPKKVVIAGGGIAGIEAADALLQCGHQPVIYEKENHLGGQFMLAGIAPGKADFLHAGQMAIAKLKNAMIPIHTNSFLYPHTLEQEKADALIIAIGSHPAGLPVEGADQSFVLQAHDVLKGKEVAGENVVVIGGGLVGIETAEFLASKGKKVTVLEMKEEVMKELGSLRKIATQMALAKLPVTIQTSAMCKKIGDHKVFAKKGEEELCFDADTVVLATGSVSNDANALIEACKKLNIPYYVVGDAKKAPGMAIDAIADAYKAVLKINGQLN
jgi:2,4-dienoyl-CoA reductase-like NADH-dependent reductase (Old Yellow Enzyme family)/thioredoxin reductase